MKHFFRGGRELPVGQSDRVNELSSYHVLSSRPISINDRLLRPLGRSRSDAREGGDRESLRTTFVLASPLLRPYTTDLPCFDHRFTTFASGMLGQTVVKRWSADGQTPKLVRSRYGSDQEATDFSSFVPTDYLPYNYDVSRRVQENRKTVTKRVPKKPRGECQENQQRSIREGVRYDF